MIKTRLLLPGLLAASMLAVATVSAPIADGDDLLPPRLRPSRLRPSAVRLVSSAGVDDFSRSESDQFHGVVKPAQMAELPSLVPGTIATVHVQEGQYVTKGTPLVTLDDRVPRARLMAATVEANLTGALRRAEVQLQLAESRLSRVQKAVSKGAGAEFELLEATGARDQAEAAVAQQRDILRAAEANRQLVEAQLHQYTIAAPFDGLVTQIHRKAGAVDPSQKVITVASFEQLEVEMHLPSDMFGSFRRGDQIRLKAGTPIAGPVSATVVSASPIIDSASDTFRCLLRIDNTKTPTRLPAGFSVVLDSSDASQRHATRHTHVR
ncbi:MAG: efflux RND transporter periplasmic adaptor subunit [Fuerstiella sp.]